MGRFFKELWRRRIIQFGLAYLIGGWLIVQVAVVIFPELGFPGWAAAFVIVLVALGFPLVVILAWAQETQAITSKAAEDSEDAATVAPRGNA